MPVRRLRQGVSCGGRSGATGEVADTGRDPPRFHHRPSPRHAGRVARRGSERNRPAATPDPANGRTAGKASPSKSGGRNAKRTGNRPNDRRSTPIARYRGIVVEAIIRNRADRSRWKVAPDIGTDARPPTIPDPRPTIMLRRPCGIADRQDRMTRPQPTLPRPLTPVRWQRERPADRGLSADRPAAIARAVTAQWPPLTPRPRHHEAGRPEAAFESANPEPGPN